MFKKISCLALALSLLMITSFNLDTSLAKEKPLVKLGNEVLLSDYMDKIKDKRVGLVTNHTGIDSRKESIIDIFNENKHINLTALYAPEHGIDGKASAGEYVESYTHEELGIPVYSLYGRTREPTGEMLEKVDVLLFDIQDIGARTYTYMSTLNYCMKAGEKYNTPVIVLDRPNPLGGMRIDGPVMEEKFISFVGVDNLPKAHGMTVGELARFFNRNIDVELFVIPMQGYQRNMIFKDTGLPWRQTSPNIPDLDSCFLYMATGLGEGTGVYQAEKFKWIGGKELDAQEYANKLNESDLKGIEFFPEEKNSAGGANLNITDYHSFNPVRTGIHALGHAFKLEDFRVPKSNDEIVMFDKIMGTDKIGKWLEEEKSPEKIIKSYSPGLEEFRQKRQNYLLNEYDPKIIVRVDNKPVRFDSSPSIDENNRLMVPIRAISEALEANVKWDGKNKTAVITRKNNEVSFTIGSNLAATNDKNVKMDTAPVIKDMRTMVPARYVSELLGANVRWDNHWRVVNIN